jgi:carotenoid cleavage dioxygenase
VPGPRRANNDGGATHLFTFGSTILALGDGTLAYELTADLATRRRVDLAGAGRGLRPRVALDRHSGALHLIGVGPGNAQTHVTVSAGAMTRATRPLEDTPRVEDLTITRDHVVFLADGLIGVTPRSAIHESPVMWSPIEGGARRLAGAHDDTRGVVAHTTGPALERWTLHPRATTVEHQIVDDTPLTFPNRNPGMLTCPQRYLWTCSAHSVHRHDLVTGERASHPVGTDHQPAEFQFVADPSQAWSEDGGWLVGLIHDRSHAAADLLVLDAHLDGRPIATVHIPRPVPNGTHAAWIPVNP